MNDQQAKDLRKPFPAEAVGKLPRVWCAACSRDKQRKHCDQHERAKCRTCGNNITTAHLHLDFVGHAEITDRLLQVDPQWSWEPVAFGSEGLPLLDKLGGLWIKLTVAGVTRFGYGHADGKEGPDAVKEAIGDALRNSAMRFGVALDLWGAHGGEERDESRHQPRGIEAQQETKRVERKTGPRPAADPTQKLKQAINYLLNAPNLDEAAKRLDWVAARPEANTEIGKLIDETDAEVLGIVDGTYNGEPVDLLRLGQIMVDYTERHKAGHTSWVWTLACQPEMWCAGLI